MHPLLLKLREALASYLPLRKHDSTQIEQAIGHIHIAVGPTTTVQVRVLADMTLDCGYFVYRTKPGWPRKIVFNHDKKARRAHLGFGTDTPSTALRQYFTNLSEGTEIRHEPIRVTAHREATLTASRPTLSRGIMGATHELMVYVCPGTGAVIEVLER